MAKTQQEILDGWISYAISTGKIQCIEEIPERDMERLVEASKRHERILLMHEINKMKIK